MKGGGIVYSPEWLQIALRVEISDNVTCVCKRLNLVSITPWNERGLGCFVFVNAFIACRCYVVRVFNYGP